MSKNDHTTEYDAATIGAGLAGLYVLRDDLGMTLRGEAARES